MESGLISKRNNDITLVDNKPVIDLVTGVLGLPAILVAYELGIFTRLANNSLTLESICETFSLNRNGAEAMLAMCVSTGLLDKQDDLYLLNDVSRCYFLEESDYFYGGYLDQMINNAHTYSMESIKEALITEKTQIYERDKDIFDVHSEQAERARVFTRAMHSASNGPARVWPTKIDLMDYHMLLDIGGGSGAHSIAAVQIWDNLKATVFDMENVCTVTREMALQANVPDKVEAMAGNIWQDSYPDADIHFYSQIYHDWPEDKCEFLTRKSFESLSKGGRIILHEVLYDDDKTGPMPAAANSIGMMLWTQGRQYSAQELTNMLKNAGFVGVQAFKTGFAYWSIVTGTKPT